MVGYHLSFPYFKYIPSSFHSEFSSEFEHSRVLEKCHFKDNKKLGNKSCVLNVVSPTFCVNVDSPREIMAHMIVTQDLMVERYDT